MARNISTIDITNTTRILTTLNGQSFTTPAIVGLAFRKIYRHRIQITTPEFERSVQYGSNPSTTKAMLEGVTADQVLEAVLQEVEVPV